jgi:hypothetical protein
MYNKLALRTYCIKMNLEEEGWIRPYSSTSGWGPVAGSCEQDHKFWASIKYREFLD